VLAGEKKLASHGKGADPVTGDLLEQKAPPTHHLFFRGRAQMTQKAGIYFHTEREKGSENTGLEYCGKGTVAPSLPAREGSLQ